MTKIHSIKILDGDDIVFEMDNIDGYKFEENNFLIIFYEQTKREIIKLNDKLWLRVSLEEVPE